jgi:3'-phosphoadenosine 5'-phosphosulfate (PAPS) 3'-phosphatase
MRKSIFKTVSLLLTITFMSSQIQPAYGLSPWMANDTTPMSDTKNDIAKNLKPGAIGNGQPLINLVKGILPKQIELDNDIEAKLRKAVDLAIRLHIQNQNSIPSIHAEKADQTLANLYVLKNELSKRVYLFNAEINGPEDYLLGFNFQGIIGLDIDLIDQLDTISSTRLSQYIYHECVPEKDVVARGDHRIIYTEMQGAVFGSAEVLALKKSLRKFIAQKISPKIAPELINKLKRALDLEKARAADDLLEELSELDLLVVDETSILRLLDILSDYPDKTQDDHSYYFYAILDKLCPEWLPEIIALYMRIQEKNNSPAVEGWFYKLFRSYPEESKEIIPYFVNTLIGEMDHPSWSGTLNNRAKLLSLLIELGGPLSVYLRTELQVKNASYRQKILLIVDKIYNANNLENEPKTSFMDMLSEVVNSGEQEKKTRIIAGLVSGSPENIKEIETLPGVHEDLLTIAEDELIPESIRIGAIEAIGRNTDAVKANAERLLALLYNDRSYYHNIAKAASTAVKTAGPSLVSLCEKISSDIFYRNIDEENIPFALEVLGSMGPAALNAYPAVIDNITTSYHTVPALEAICNIDPGKNQEKTVKALFDAYFDVKWYFDDGVEANVREKSDAFELARKELRTADPSVRKKLLAPILLEKLKILKKAIEKSDDIKYDISSAEISGLVDVTPTDSLQIIREYRNRIAAQDQDGFDKRMVVKLDHLLQRGIRDLLISHALISEGTIYGAETMETCISLTAGAIEAARELKRFIQDKKTIMIDEKADKSLVTDADVLLNQLLKENFSPLGIPFVGEESEHLIDVINKGTYIAVDPIDGTSNFVKMFNGELDKPALDNVTLISLVKDGTPVIGISLNHYTGELDVAINDGKIKLESHIDLKMLGGLDYPGTPGSVRVSRLESSDALIMGSKASDPVNEKYSKKAPTARIGGLGFRIISLCNNTLRNGLVYHKSQKAGLWDLASPYVFASLNGVTIYDGNGDPLDFTKAPYFPGNGAMALKGNALLFEKNPNMETLPAINSSIEGPAGTVNSVKNLLNASGQQEVEPIKLSPETEKIVLDNVKAMYQIPEEAISKINTGRASDVDKALSSLAEEMVQLLPRVADVSVRVEGAEKGELGPKALYYYGKVFAKLDIELMRNFMKYFTEKAGHNTMAFLNMTMITFARGFVATEVEIDPNNPEDLKKFMENINITDKFHQYAAAEMTITDSKDISRTEANALLKAAELAVRKDVHIFEPLSLHMQAKNFSKTLMNVLKKNPDKTYLIAIDSDLGKDQHSQLMKILTAFDNLEKMFPNLNIVRRSGSSGKNNLSSEINNLIDRKEIDPQNIFMVVKQDNLTSKKFETLQGKTWITAIDDSMIGVNTEGAYLPIFEAATISILASINADAEAIKKVYDSIALDPKTHQEITLEAIEEMIQNRTVLIMPRIEKIPLDDLKVLYERVRTVYLAA